MKNLFLLLLMLAIVSEMSKGTEREQSKTVYHCKLMAGSVHKVVCSKAIK